MEDGLPQGYGVLQSVEKVTSEGQAEVQRGLTHEGLFHAGKKHGLGRQTTDDGSYLYGFFYYNQPVGKVISYDPHQNTSATFYYPSPQDSAYRCTQQLSVTSQRPGKPALNEDGHHDTVLNYLLDNSRAMNENGQLQTGFTDSGFEQKKGLKNCFLERAKNLESQ